MKCLTKVWKWLTMGLLLLHLILVAVLVARAPEPTKISSDNLSKLGEKLDGILLSELKREQPVGTDETQITYDAFRKIAIDANRELHNLIQHDAKDSKIYVVAGGWNKIPDALAIFASDALRLVNVWYAAFLVVLPFLFFLTTPRGSHLISDLRLTTLSLWGLSFGFERRSGQTLQGAVLGFKRGVARTARIEATKLNIYGYVRNVRSTLTEKLQNLSLNVGDLQFAVHIPVPFIDPVLMQLTDYIDQDATSGRFFPVRYGVVGMAYRTGEVQHRYRPKQIHLVSDRARLVRDWGMTKIEANTHRPRPMSSIPIKSNRGDVVGVFYLGWTHSQSVSKGDMEQLALTVLESSKTEDLGRSLSELHAHLEEKLSSREGIALYDTVKDASK